MNFVTDFDQHHFVSCRIHRFYISHQEALEKLRTGNITGVLFVIDSFVDYFNFVNYRTGVVRMTKDRLLLQANVFYFRKYSRLVFSMDDELRLYFQHGLTGHWYDQYRKEIDYALFGKAHVPKGLLFENILGSVVILIVSLTICCIIFCFELLALRFELIRRPIEFVTF